MEVIFSRVIIVHISMILGAEHAQRRIQDVKSKLMQKKKVAESLNLPALQLASDYYTEQEMVQFKKPKKKVRHFVQLL